MVGRWLNSWTGGKSVAADTALASDGTTSLTLSASYTGGSWQEAGAFVQPENGADWSQYRTISMDVYVPEGANDFLAQVYTKTGDDWTWTNSADITLTPGDWNPVRVPLSALGDVRSVHEFGIKIGSSTAVYDGTFNIDNVRLTGQATGTQPNVTIEFPAVENAVLNVPGLQDGTYIVELWNTMTGTVMSIESATATDGTISIDLPSFTTDVAIKIKPV